jgi:DNA-binding MarR family transcriptional regulator
MTPNPPPDPEVAGWLHTLGITSLCQWDVLVFLSHHQTTLLGAASLARLLGYATEPLVAALDHLEALALVERSRLSQGARFYQCTVLRPAPRRDALAQLLALAGHRTGRGRIAHQLQRDRSPGETLYAAKRFLADAPQRRRVVRRQADARTERSPRWRKAI